MCLPLHCDGGIKREHNSVWSYVHVPTSSHSLRRLLIKLHKHISSALIWSNNMCWPCLPLLIARSDSHTKSFMLINMLVNTLHIYYAVATGTLSVWCRSSQRNGGRLQSECRTYAGPVTGCGISCGKCNAERMIRAGRLCAPPRYGQGWSTKVFDRRCFCRLCRLHKMQHSSIFWYCETASEEFYYHVIHHIALRIPANLSSVPQWWFRFCLNVQGLQ